MKIWTMRTLSESVTDQIYLVFESRKALILLGFPGFCFFVATNWLQQRPFLVAISSRT